MVCAIFRANAVVLDLLPGKLSTFVVFDEGQKKIAMLVTCFLTVCWPYRCGQQESLSLQTVGKILSLPFITPNSTMI